ncbi:MAG: response regulator [Candidatus Scalindua sp.]|nr:response regulator [Candidatus Scalindua sp.]
MAKAKIMIVEDEWITAEDIKMSLESLGYTVTSVSSSGEEAIQNAEKGRPDLVLMDIVLKGEMDGIEAARQIRACYNIPIIYLTAYADENTLERASITEPFGYIVKPFVNEDLKISIEIALYKHRIEKERRRLIEELQGALPKITTLSGLLPICPSCKKIRDAEGNWK